MKTETNKIKSKLIKLLNLTAENGASPGEIENAVNAATQIMKRHNLTRDDLDMSDDQDITKNIKFDRKQAFTLSTKIYHWEKVLLNFVCDFLGTVKCYREPGKFMIIRNGMVTFRIDHQPKMAKRINFYGPADDCETAVELLHELQESIQTMAIVRFGKWASGDGGVYCQGFVQGLKSALKKSVENLLECDEQTHALMIQSEKNELAIRESAINWLEETHNIRVKTVAASGGARGSSDAFEKGKRDGSNYNVTKKAKTHRLT